MGNKVSSGTEKFRLKRRTFLAGASLAAATAAMGVPRAKAQEALLTVGRGMADMTGEPLGAHMVGMDAPEVIQGVAIALKCNATKAQFDATMGIHPSAAEEFVTMSTKRAEPDAAKPAQ